MSRRAIGLLLSPLGVVLITAGRLLIISDFNTTTATTIASSGGYVNTLLGSIAPLLPVFIPYIALLMLLLRQFVLSIVAFVFTAFIAPTPLSRPATRRLVVVDSRQVLKQLLGHSTLYLVTIAIIAVIIGIGVWHYLDSVTEVMAALAVTAVLITLLFTPLIANLSELNLASTQEHRIIDQFSSLHPSWTVVILLVIVVLLVIPYAGSYSSTLTGAVAVLAALALFPYVTNFYPAPGGRNYYVSAIRAPWLPAEKIVTSTGRNYYGYVLQASQGWFTVLRSKNRKIVYIPAKDVVRRAVCETVMAKAEEVSYPPIVSTFYRPPPNIRVCADRKALIRNNVPRSRS